MSKFLKQFTYAMHKKVKQKISLCIFLKIWSFYSKVRNFSCFDMLELIILFKAVNILKNTLNMKKTSSQHLLKINTNIWMEKCKIIKKSVRCIENLERLKGWVTLVTLEAANGFEPETNKWEVNILSIYIYIYILYINIYIIYIYINRMYIYMCVCIYIYTSICGHKW